VFYGVHILLVEKLVPDVDGVKLSCVQFAVSGTISCVLMFLFETPQLPAIWSAVLPILYSGVLSCGVGYTFQIVGQKYTEATIATLIMCLESVFGVLAGALLLNEILTGREILGCVIMFAAIVLSQLSDVITEKLGKRKAVSEK
jgi:drug/metabolite transporter (DMT)-like permease